MILGIEACPFLQFLLMNYLFLTIQIMSIWLGCGLLTLVSSE